MNRVSTIFFVKCVLCDGAKVRRSSCIIERNRAWQHTRWSKVCKNWSATLRPFRACAAASEASLSAAKAQFVH